MTHDSVHLTEAGACQCLCTDCNETKYCTCPDEDRTKCTVDHPAPTVIRTGIKLTDEELHALAEFFNNDNYSMDTAMYDRIGRKFLVAAAKAGLYDEDA